MNQNGCAKAIKRHFRMPTPLNSRHFVDQPFFGGLFRKIEGQQEWMTDARLFSKMSWFLALVVKSPSKSPTGPDDASQELAPDIILKIQNNYDELPPLFFAQEPDIQDAKKAGLNILSDNSATRLSR